MKTLVFISLASVLGTAAVVANVFGDSREAIDREIGREVRRMNRFHRAIPKSEAVVADQPAQSPLLVFKRF